MSLVRSVGSPLWRVQAGRARVTRRWSTCRRSRAAMRTLAVGPHNGEVTSDEPIVAIVGPTAVGKSALAVELALQLGGEVVNGDSMQIYRGMDIGTAKV